MTKSLTRKLNLELNRIKTEAIKGSAALAESLGLGVEQLNDPTFFMPTEDDFVLVPVRMLSATDVQSRMFNFGHNQGEALKHATRNRMFDGLTIFKNHDLVVENALGKTEGTFWDEVTPGAPAGVTGYMKLDKKSDPKVVRCILTGVLDSVSVTIGFDFEPSHPDMEEMDFYMGLGSEVDGKLVQCNITKVNRVYELSVVWTGADQYAKVPGDDGAIHVPGVHSNSHSFKEGLMDPKKLAALLGLSADTTVEALEAALAEFKAKQEQQAELQAKLTTAETALTEATTQVEALKVEVATAQEATTTLQAEVATLKPQAEMGLAHFAAQKEEAKRIYALAVGDAKEEAILKLMDEATSLEVLAGFIKTFSDQAEKIAPLHCTKCGCVELSRKASDGKGHKGDDQQATLGVFEMKRLEQTVDGIHRA